MTDDAIDLGLFRWMVEMRLYVQESSMVNYPYHKWACLDVDGEIVAMGSTPIGAIKAAQQIVENPTDEEYAIRQRQRLDERDLDRADHMRDVEKENNEN